MFFVQLRIAPQNPKTPFKLLMQAHPSTFKERNVKISIEYKPETS